MAFNYEEIIEEKQEIIDELIHWVYVHTETEEELRQVLSICGIDDVAIENYCAELFA